ncbi:MAG: hypothetical protein U0230_11940 [Polyangiales bacterium]
MSLRPAVLVALLLALPGIAQAQPAADAGARIQLAFQGGFLGKLHFSDSAANPGSYQFSYGFLARIDTAVARYLVAGGEVGFSRFNAESLDAAGIGRGTYADVGSVWKLRYPIPLDSGKYLEPYLMVPLGITFFAPSTQWDVMAGGAGFYTGGFAGLTYFLGPRTMMIGELGWQHRFTWQEFQSGGEHRTFANGGQLTFRVGLALRL